MGDADGVLGWVLLEEFWDLAWQQDLGRALCDVADSDQVHLELRMEDIFRHRHAAQ